MKIKHSKGIGLLELMLALTITTIVILLAIRYFQSTRASQNVTIAASMYRDVFKASQQYYQQNAPDGPIQSGALVGAGLLSAQFKNNPWGGAITITPKAATGSSHTGYFAVIAMTKIPSASCDLLAKQVGSTLTVSESLNASRCSAGVLTVSYELY